MAILKVHYSDATNGFRKYEPGDDVSHIADSEKEFLRKNGHLEESNDETIETVKPKSKAKKGAENEAPIDNDETIETVND